MDVLFRPGFYSALPFHVVFKVCSAIFVSLGLSLKSRRKVVKLTFKIVKRIYGTSAILIGKGFMVPG